MSRSRKKDVKEDPEYDDGFAPSSVVIGEIELELDESGNLVVPVDDEYEDAYATADFTGAVVSLLADRNPTAVAERRGDLVAAAKRRFESDRGGCWPGCAASALGMTPVYRYDKVLVVDSGKELADLRRQIDGLDGFDPRELRTEISAIRDMTKSGNVADALRPFSSSGKPVQSVVDPAARHCLLPDEACGVLRISHGTFSRPAGADAVVDLVRLLPGDRADLVRIDVDDPGASFEDDLAPDAGKLAADNGLLSPGQCDRLAEAMGLLWNGPFVDSLRARAAESAEAFDPEDPQDDPVSAAPAPRGETPFAVSPVKPDCAVSASADGMALRLAKLKPPKPLKAAANEGNSIVRVYASPAELAFDENRADAVYGPEFDDTPRHLLAIASALPPDTGLADRVRSASDSRLSAQTVEDVVRGGKAILVGDRVALRAAGAEQVFMRARDEKTGELFWALQHVRAAGPAREREECRPGKDCYAAPPSNADAVAYARDSLAAARDRLKAAGKKFIPDEDAVTRIVASTTDSGHYPTPEFAPLERAIAFSEPQKDVFVNCEFRFVAPDDPQGDVADAGSSGYLELAAATLLGALFPAGIRLPKKIGGSEWLVRLSVPDDPRYAELLGGGGTDPLRLKFLVESALLASAVSVLLAGTDPADVAGLLATVDIRSFIDTPKGNDVWKAALEKKLTADAVAAAARDLRAKSPLLDHVADFIRADPAPPPVLASSSLDDWNGFRPATADIERTDDDDRPVEPGPPPARTSRAAVVMDAKAELAERVASVYKRLGVPASGAAVHAFLDEPSPDGAAALKRSGAEAWSVLGRLSSGMKHDSVARFRNAFSRADASRVLAEQRAAMDRLRAAEDVADVAGAWIDLAEELPDEMAMRMAEDAACRLRLVGTGVDELLARMEAAKEAIKNEKIKFVEAVDDATKSAMAALRNLGIQTIDDQIMAFDRDNDVGRQSAGDSGEAYDTRHDYEDDGVDYE